MFTAPRPLALGLLVLLTAGCATFEGSPQPLTPEAAGKHMKEVEDVQSAIDKERDPAKQRAFRNNLVWAYIRAADDQYRLFLVSVNKSMKGSNFGLDLAGVLVSSAGAVVHGAANELSATAAALAGARGSINKELYFERTLPAIEAAMRANRLRVKTAIATHLLNDGVDRYPLQQALADLNDYQLAASLNAAIQEITTTSGNAADQAQRHYENATESCEPDAATGEVWGNINDAVMPLVEAAAKPASASRSTALKKLAAIYLLATGDTIAEATTSAEAEAQAATIVRAARKFCTKESADALLAQIAAL